MTIHKQFGSGVAWMAFGNWTEQLVNFVVFLVLARLLGAEAFGLLAMAAAFLIICESLVRESIGDFLIAEREPSPQHFNAAFWILFGVAVVLVALLAALSGPIAAFYRQPAVAWLVLALLPNVPLIALTAVPVAILRRELRFRTLALRAIAGVVAGGLVGIVMALQGFGVWSLAAQKVVQVAVNVVLAWAAVRWRPGLAFSRADARKVLGFGGTVVGLRLGELSSIQVPTMLVGATMGPLTLGYFSIAWRVVEISSFLIVTPLRLASQSAFAALRHRGEDAPQLLIDIGKLSGMLAFPAFFGLAALSSQLLELAFGAKWVPAAAMLGPMAFLGAYICIEKVHQAFCLAAGRAHAVTALTWLEVCLASAGVLLARHWGDMAIAAAFVLPFYLVWPIRFRVVAGIAGLRTRDLMRIHAGPVAGAFVMALIVAVALRQVPGAGPLAAVAMGTAVGLAAYLGFSFLFLRARFHLFAAALRSWRAKPGGGAPAAGGAADR